MTIYKGLRARTGINICLLVYLFTGVLPKPAAGQGEGGGAFKWNRLPVKALLLSCPDPQDVPLLCRFIREDLPKEGVNTLCLRIEYQYQFASHPELADVNALSKKELQSIVAACGEAHIRLIPTMNLLAHQSDKEVIGPLLKRYPQFDESPDYNPPVPWKNGGMFDFYTKSLCPLHPDLFKVLFPIMDELIEVCGADALHVGLDEVWILGYDKCPRCGGRDKAELLAGYIRALHDHLEQKHCEMWMWSDRLIDGKTTNLLGWQASMNDTYRAIDMIPKDIMICDWKYEDAPPTPGYFAIKGFRVLASSCYKPDVALAQLEQLWLARKNGMRQDFSLTLAQRMQGVLGTMWFNTGDFIRYYHTMARADARGRDWDGPAIRYSDSTLVKNTIMTFVQQMSAIRREEGGIDQRMPGSFATAIDTAVKGDAGREAAWQPPATKRPADVAKGLTNGAFFAGVRALAGRRVPWLASHLVFTRLSPGSAAAHEEDDKTGDQPGMGSVLNGGGDTVGGPVDRGTDEFELSTSNGQVHIAASGPNAADVGLGWYLKYYCHRSMSHMGDNLSPVYPLPEIREPVRVQASAKVRHALNYCTYNYTYSFYTWKDWEHELDWMALNGVNTMLVANGEEAVWQNVLRRIGYTQPEIDAYLTGPAYNAWWLMGNIEGWGGPMPAGQIGRREELVQKMLGRMQALGIEPVMPAFFGMVPSTLKNKIKAHIIVQGTWGAFTRPDILDPADTTFNTIGGLFYEETRKLYGEKIRYFSGDPFHEGGITEGVDLRKAGAGIQQLMQRYYPGAVWVLQGWQQNPRVEMLEGLDKSKILVQELFGETTNNWEKRNAYEGSPFIWCMITNYGERPGLFGKLQRYANEPHRAAAGPFGGYLKGIGVMPEGIDNNPVAFDFMLEMGWHSGRVDAAEWIKNYVLYRYGKYDADVLHAWQLFLQTIYSSPEGYQEGPPENILCARPALQIKSVSSWGTLKKNYDISAFRQAVTLFAAAAPRFKGCDTYTIDLINFVRQAGANKADTVFARLVDAYRKKDLSAFDRETTRFLALSDATEILLNTHPYYRLPTYQRQALGEGVMAEEKRNNLHNAMMLITYWGENNPKEDNLHEYAYKEWAGMMGAFYKRRWSMYFERLRGELRGTGKPGVVGEGIDWFRWERDWEVAHEQVMTLPRPVGLMEAVRGVMGL